MVGDHRSASYITPRWNYIKTVQN